MNKAKAIFSAMMIVAVAGTSGVCWYLNDQGIIGSNKEPVSDSVIEYNDDYIYNDNNNNNSYNDNNDHPEKENKDEQETTTKDAKPESEIAGEEISEFLTVFSKVYFSENEKYTQENRSGYELIRFAYSHLKRTDSKCIDTIKADDGTGYYNRVSFDDVNEVLDKYLGVTVPRESVYTENDYAFFRYSDGYFMTPAADGLPFINVTVADKFEIEDDKINVSFTIYSGDDFYAEGEAVIKHENDTFKLIYYRLLK